MTWRRRVSGDDADRIGSKGAQRASVRSERRAATPTATAPRPWSVREAATHHPTTADRRMAGVDDLPVGAEPMRRTPELAGVGATAVGRHQMGASSTTAATRARRRIVADPIGQIVPPGRSASLAHRVPRGTADLRQLSVDPGQVLDTGESAPLVEQLGAGRRPCRPLSGRSGTCDGHCRNTQCPPVQWPGRRRPGPCGAVGVRCHVENLTDRAVHLVRLKMPWSLHPRAYPGRSRTPRRRARTILTVVRPAALPGVVSGALLAVARAAGETDPLLFTVGTVSEPNRSLFEGTNTALSARSSATPANRSSARSTGRGVPRSPSSCWSSC